MPVDPSTISGNAPLRTKQIALHVFHTYVWDQPTLFAFQQGKNLRCVDISVVNDTDSPVPPQNQAVRVIGELDVTEDMCDKLHNMHPGFAAYVVDMLTSNAIAAGGVAHVSVRLQRQLQRFNHDTGFLALNCSQLNLSITFHTPIKCGTTIKSVNTVVSTCGEIAVARSQIYDAHTGQLLATGEQTKLPPSPTPASFNKSRTPDGSGTATATSTAIVSSGDSSRSRGSSSSRPPEILLSNVLGTAPPELKRRLFDHGRLWDLCGPFAADTGRLLQLREVNYDIVSGKKMINAVWEIQVVEAMTNGMDNLHGGCASFLVVSTTAMMRYVVDGPKDTASLNISFHAPAVRGMILKIVARSVTSGKRISESRCNIFDSNSERLLVSGSHVQVQSDRASL